MVKAYRGIAGRVYDLLTTEDRWLSTDLIADRLGVPKASVQQVVTRIPDGELWHGRDDPTSNGFGTSREYRAVPDQWDRIAPDTSGSAVCGCGQPKARRSKQCRTCWTGTKEETMTKIPTAHDDEAWYEYATRVLGLDDEKERPCGHCDGTGIITAPVRVSKTGIIHTVRGSTSGTSTAAFGRWCENPRLEDLDRVAELAGTDLDGAARFLRRVRDLILIEVGDA